MVILHAVAFINDHVLPSEFGQNRFVFDDIFIRGEEHIQFGGTHLALHNSTHLGRAFVIHNLQNSGIFGIKFCEIGSNYLFILKHITVSQQSPFHPPTHKPTHTCKLNPFMSQGGKTMSVPAPQGFVLRA